MMPTRLVRPAVRLVAVATTVLILVACSGSTTIVRDAPAANGNAAPTDPATDKATDQARPTPSPTAAPTVAPTPDTPRSDESPAPAPTPTAVAAEPSDRADIEWPPGLATSTANLSATLPVFEIELDGTQRPQVRHGQVEAADDYVTYVVSADDGTVLWARSSDTPSLIVGGGTDIDNGGLGLQLTEPVIVVVHARTDRRPIAVGGPLLFDPMPAD